MKKKEYDVYLKILGSNYSSSGVTVADALKVMSVKNPKGHGLLTVRHGDVQKDRVISRSNVFRLFGGSRIGREVALKQVSQIFDGL